MSSANDQNADKAPAPTSCVKRVTIDASFEAVWEAFHDFHALDKVLAGIVESCEPGDGDKATTEVGATRVINKIIFETCEKNERAKDEEFGVIQYRMTAAEGLPVANNLPLIGVCEVAGTVDGKTHLMWSAKWTGASEELYQAEDAFLAAMVKTSAANLAAKK